MKISKVIIPVFLVFLIAFSWISALRGLGENISSYSEYMKSAEISIEDGLYEQAIEFYKKSIEYKGDKDTYYKIKDVYDKYYKEEHTPTVRSSYIADMETASAEYPKEADFWATTANLYLDASNYKAAYKCVKEGINFGAKSEELNSIYNELTYKTKVNFKLYDDVYTSLNGYISVNEGNKWSLLDGKGEMIDTDYEYIGLMNDKGKGFYKNNIDTRILDEKGVTRARFDFDIEEAGILDESTGYTPVKIDGNWKYVNMNGEFLKGEFDKAGSFFNDTAAVCKDDVWYIIDSKGDKVSDKTFKDIKLDLYGCHLQSGIIIAMENDKYHLYKEDLSQISDFECDDIDICIDGNLIAFMNNDKWGFVDVNGKIVVDPTYNNAKSFSNKLAAVCNDRNLWGYINESYDLVIDYEFEDAFYFNSDEVSIVTITENTYQILSFMF